MKIAIVSLIYKSIPYLEFVKRGIEKNTSKDLDYEIWFIANDASWEVLEYLKNNKIKYIEHHNTDPYDTIDNKMKNIYKAWNRAKEIECDIIIFVNSDFWVGPGWLEPLIKDLDNKVCSSVLVESSKLASLLPHTIVKNFGMTIDEFKEEEFEKFAEIIKYDIYQPMGPFMPMAIRQEVFKATGFPEGNPKIFGGMTQVPGDQYFFYFTLKNLGIEHVCALNSVVYHFQMGEESSD